MSQSDLQSLTYDAVVFSPHLDDAVLSCAARLSRGSAHVVAVFAGAPSAALGVTEYDRLCRASSLRDRHLERLAEDENAMMVMGCERTLLNELDSQFRSYHINVHDLALKLSHYISASTEVWAPAGIGSHKDHVLVRDAVLEAVRGRADIEDIFLYADVLYCLRYGWPSWVTQEPEPDFVDVSSGCRRKWIAQA